MAGSPADFLSARLGHVRQAMARGEADALLVTHLPNVRYLTGFAGSSASVVVAADRVCLITDFRYMSAAEALLGEPGYPTADLVRVDRSYDEAAVDTLDRLGVRRIGIEAAHLSVKRHRWFAERLSDGSDAPDAAHAPGSATRRLVPTDRIVETARLRKDRHEVAIFRAAARLLSEVAREVLPGVAPGRSERHVAADVDWAMRRAGFERPAFETIVASGPNGALPHARPTARVLSLGDLVVLDFGGVYDGYCVDLTRTVCLGEPGADAARWHEAVTAAQAAALAAVLPGQASSAIDGAARRVLDDYGLGEAFGHGTGHGLGLEIHEEPRLSRPRPDGQDEAATVDVGMVFTVEPGVYLPGRGGVRIEDDVLVTSQGGEVLTDVPKGLAW